MRAQAVAIVVALAAGCGPPAVMGLRAEQPPLKLKSYVEVGSRRPEFRWEAFPAAADREADPRLERIRSVTYDLRIWQAEESTGYPLMLVYSRDALPGPRHVLEEDLAPATSYVWSVRARFDLEGQVRVTPWSMFAPSPGFWDPSRSPVVPALTYFRFKTPD